MSQNVICPYCHNPAKFMTSKEFYGVDYGTNLYICEPCDARVGTHGRGDTPLGTMADSLLRKTRMETHKLVDPIWKNSLSIYNRSEVYKAISKLMNIPIEETHIGMFDYGKCQTLMFLIRTGELQRYLNHQREMKRQLKKRMKEKRKERMKKSINGRFRNGTSDVPIPQGIKLYGIFSAVSKKFVFGIQETSKSKAYKKLFKKIGKDAYKYRFEARKLKHYINPPKEENKDVSRNRNEESTAS